MVSHTSVTNVTARGPLALHLTTRLGPVPVNGHRNLPGYVKNGSVSENSIPSSGQELHIPDEEHSAHTRPCEDEKPSPVVEEERETVMWPPGPLAYGDENGEKKQIMKQSQDGLEGTAACINTASFFSCESSRNIADWWGSRQKGCITFVSWAAFIWGMMTLFVVANTLNSFANHLPHSECVKGWKQTAVSNFFSTAITVVILFSVCFFGKCLLLSFCAEIKPGLVKVVASNSLNNLCKARWILSVLSGTCVDNFHQQVFG